MSNKITESNYVCMPIVGQAISNTNVTGRYIPIAGVRRILLLMAGGASAATKTFKIELLKATDIDGTGAASIDSATGTANTLVKTLTVALASVANTDTVTVNGTVFTHAAATSTPEFNAAAGLKTVVEAAFPAINCSVAGTTVTMNSDDGTLLTVVGGNVAGTVTVATTQSFCILEVDRADFGSTTTHVAPKITTTGNGIMSCVMVLEQQIQPVTQSVAAS